LWIAHAPDPSPLAGVLQGIVSRLQIIRTCTVSSPPTLKAEHDKPLVRNRFAAARLPCFFPQVQSPLTFFWGHLRLSSEKEHTGMRQERERDTGSRRNSSHGSLCSQPRSACHAAQ